jgi:hypothetical protein
MCFQQTPPSWMRMVGSRRPDSHHCRHTLVGSPCGCLARQRVVPDIYRQDVLVYATKYVMNKPCNRLTTRHVSEGFTTCEQAVSQAYPGSCFYHFTMAWLAQRKKHATTRANIQQNPTRCTCIHPSLPTTRRLTSSMTHPHLFTLLILVLAAICAHGWDRLSGGHALPDRPLPPVYQSTRSRSHYASIPSTERGRA